MILILIVVEDGLVQVSVQIKSSRLCVLILVVVDNGLVLKILSVIMLLQLCLNPCCSGRWSRMVLALKELED